MEEETYDDEPEEVFIMPEEVQNKLFKEMITTKGKDGTGLGLFIVKGLVEAMKGNVQLKSTKDKLVDLYIQGKIDDTIYQSKLDSNLNRMARQKQFVTSFFGKAIAKTKEKITFPIDVYNSSKEYFITDLDVAEISFLASCVVKNDIGLEFKSIKGSMKKGKDFPEYHADDESIYNTILDVFYTPVS